MAKTTSINIEQTRQQAATAIKADDWNTIREMLSVKSREEGKAILNEIVTADKLEHLGTALISAPAQVAIDAAQIAIDKGKWGIAGEIASLTGTEVTKYVADAAKGAGQRDVVRYLALQASTQEGRRHAQNLLSGQE